MSYSIFAKTSRLTQHYLSNSTATDIDKTVLLFIHGNGSSAIFWDSIISHNELSEIYCIAPDMRGYGQTDSESINATKSMQDVVLDIQELLDVLGISTFHVVAHSLGGAVAYQLATDISSRIKSMTLINPCSPYGFGGTKDEIGTPCWADYAGSGGGITNSDFVQRLAKKDRSSGNPQSAPIVVMNTFYWNESYKPEKALEEKLLDSLLAVQVGEAFYPGDFSPSENYPFVKPGLYGPINALSPQYMKPLVDDFIGKSRQIPILWLRGDQDQIVSDTSLFDFGWLGKIGLIPNYPGEELYPPQPMVAQTRAVLDKRQAIYGSQYREVIFEQCGHSPFIEQEALFIEKLTVFIQENGH